MFFVGLFWEYLYFIMYNFLRICFFTDFFMIKNFIFNLEDCMFEFYWKGIDSIL